MNRHPEFKREVLERLKALFLTRYAVYDYDISPELQNKLYIHGDNGVEVTLGEVVDRLGIPRPEDGNLMRALYAARPRIEPRSEAGMPILDFSWAGMPILDFNEAFERVDILIVSKGDHRGDGYRQVAVMTERLYIKPKWVGEMFGMPPEHVGQLVRNMGIRPPGKNRQYYLVDVLMVAAMLLDRWEAVAK